MDAIAYGPRIYIAGTYGLGGGGQWLGGLLDEALHGRDLSGRGGKGNYLRPLLENRGIFEDNDGGNGDASMALRERESKSDPRGYV